MQQKIIFGLIVMTMLTLEGCSSVSKPVPSDSTSGNNAVETGISNVVTGADTTLPASGEIASTGVNVTGSVSATASGIVKKVSGNLNGTYHLVNEYTAPSGKEPLDAAVTIKNNIIQAVFVKNVAINKESKKYQDEFSKGISGQIVGKNIKEVKVAYVNGASLTSAAFNEALQALR